MGFWGVRMGFYAAAGALFAYESVYPRILDTVSLTSRRQAPKLNKTFCNLVSLMLFEHARCWAGWITAAGAFKAWHTIAQVR